MKAFFVLTLSMLTLAASAAPSSKAIVDSLKRFAKTTGARANPSAIAKDKVLLKNGLDQLSHLLTTKSGLRIYVGEIRQNQGMTLVMTTVRDARVTPHAQERVLLDFAFDQTERQALVTRDLMNEHITRNVGHFKNNRNYELNNGLLGYQVLGNLQLAGGNERLVRTDLVFGQTLTKELDLSFFEELAERLSAF